jgi:hypothetical protein
MHTFSNAFPLLEENVQNITHTLLYVTCFGKNLHSCHAFVTKFYDPFALAYLFRNVFLLLIIDHQLAAVTHSLTSPSVGTPPTVSSLAALSLY